MWAFRPGAFSAIVRVFLSVSAFLSGTQTSLNLVPTQKYECLSVFADGCVCFGELSNHKDAETGFLGNEKNQIASSEGWETFARG